MKVLEKCVHFLSSKSPWLRLLVLDTIDIGVQAISQSEDQLLPMIHRLWPPMVKRFTDDEQVNEMEVFSHYFICFYPLSPTPCLQFCKKCLVKRTKTVIP